MPKNDMKSKVSGYAVQTRRQFVGTAGAAAGVAMMGVSAHSEAAKRHSKRNGTLKYATRSDSRGLDQHRNTYLNTTSPLSLTSMGLMDLNNELEPVPGIAVSHEVSKDLKTYTFSLRKGAEYHNGADVDAESVKWNYERILDPKVGHVQPRAALQNIDRIDVLDKWTVRCFLKEPSAVFLSNVAYYPAQLMAPNSVDTADSHPIGCGPYKFVSWKRFSQTVLKRFENWYETDADGNALPYLDTIVGLPKKEDRVRLTALRSGEVDAIDHMSYTDASTFEKKFGDEYNTWTVQQGATGFLSINLKNGPFSYQNPHGKTLRQALAHCIDQDAIHKAVFAGLSAPATGAYSDASPWHMPGAERQYEYDPDKARHLLKKAGDHAPILLTSRDAFPYMHQTGEMVHAMMEEVGFSVRHEVHPRSVLSAKWRSGEFDIDSSAKAYNPDPDAWYGRFIDSNAAATKLRTGFSNERADKLILEAKRTLDKAKRLEIYTEIENIVNAELPMFYTHYIPLQGASKKNVKNYKPSFAGPFSTKGGGLRAAWVE